MQLDIIQPLGIVLYYKRIMTLYDAILIYYDKNGNASDNEVWLMIEHTSFENRNILLIYNIILSIWHIQTLIFS